ncbi:MAG: SMI1/KNR4 family protein [Verrucomicrobiota bacterium]|nr:SMI1/KNR4 family protein [Verrucomicrobiota bacterium]
MKKIQKIWRNIVFRDAPYEPASGDEIRSFENKHHLLLPEDYIDFLLKVNGVKNLRFDKCTFNKAEHRSEVYRLSVLYPLFDHWDRHVSENLSFETVPKGFVKIGHDNITRPLMICCRKLNYGKVFYNHDHSFKSDSTKISPCANSFLDFMNSLLPDHNRDFLDELVTFGNPSDLDNYLAKENLHKVLFESKYVGPSTITSFAVSAGNLEMVKACIARGAATDYLLCAAVEFSQPDIVEYLLDLGIDVNQRDFDGKTPMDLIRPTKYRQQIRELLTSRGGVKSNML